MGEKDIVRKRLPGVGDAEWFEPTSELLARFLRHEPNTEAHPQLDFGFVRIRPKRMRVIGGIGTMGWIEETDWSALPALPLVAEHELIRTVTPQLRKGIRLLGIDRFGIDYETGAKRHRQRLPGAPVAVNELAGIVGRMAAELV